MISAVAWIPKGAAKAEPAHADIAEDDIDALRAAAEAEALGESEDDLGSESDSDEDEAQGSSDSEMDDEAAVAKARKFAAAVKNTGGGGAPPPTGDALAAAMAELDMDRYDDSDDDELMARRLLGSGNPGMAYHRNPEEDPFLKKGEEVSDSDSEEEALHLRESDLCILAARNDEDVSHLEVWVYEEPDERGEGNLYVHHAVMLPAFPLALAWLDLDPSGRADRGNFAAVGTFEPGIEIWDMDVLDAVEPVATLGGADYAAARDAMAAAETADASEDKKKKKKKKKKGAAAAPEIPVRPGSHTDAVLGLSWNKEYRNVLASASADTTVKVWDVATGAASHTLTHHTGKVQAVAWNPAEASALLSGGFDRRVCLADVRSAAGEAVAWEMPADVEALAWDPFNPTCFAASAESGDVLVYDARGGAGSAPLLRLGAHSKAASSVAYSPGVRGLIATASVDKRVKVWGWDAAAANIAPQQLAGEDLKVGALFGAQFSRDAPTVLAAAGAKGSVAVWDVAGVGAVEDWINKQAAE